MKKTCRHCGKAIPEHRNLSARYCSDECYYQAKKQRSIDRYKRISSPAMEIERNEKILALFYDLAQKKRPVLAADLDAYGFNWGLSTSDVMMDDKFFKVIGGFAYDLNSINKSVTIWKLKQPR